MQNLTREPAVAGQFYPASPRALLSEVSKFIDPYLGEESYAFGVLAPHAGYIYSGAVAGKVYAAVKVPNTVIILNPNHTGFGKRASVWPSGSWITPLGQVPVNAEVAAYLLQESPVLSADTQAHMYEHSGEVHVPFLQYRNPKVSIVPVCLSHLSWDAIESVAEAIAKLEKQMGDDLLVVASSDMNHFEDDQITRKKDRLAIEKFLAMDALGLLDTVRRFDISMCGIYPASVMIESANKIGGISAYEIAYDTSASVSGDFDRVVGYFGAVLR